MKIKNPVDLHIHTNASDGLLEPADILARIRNAGIETFSVTDHDSVAAVDEMKRRAAIFGLKLVHGVELSAEYEGRELHFLGYFIDHHNKRFLDYLYLFRRRRSQRAEEMLIRLAKLGIEISIERVAELARNGPVGRPHIADAMVEKNIVASRDEAFDKYLHDNSSVYVEKYRITPDEVIDLIHSIGGTAILAHPGLSKATDQVITSLIDKGLDGIEVIHPRHSPEEQKHYIDLAEKLGILISGGSDFHGDPDKDEKLGEHVIDLSVVKCIEEYCVEKREQWIRGEESDNADSDDAYDEVDETDDAESDDDNEEDTIDVENQDGEDDTF